MTWQEVLLWLQGPGINTAVGALMTFLAEYWPWFQSLGSKTKRLVIAGLCLIVPTVGVVVSCSFGYQPWSWTESFWPALYQGVLVAFTVNQLVHTKFLGK